MKELLSIAAVMGSALAGDFDRPIYRDDKPQPVSRAKRKFQAERKRKNKAAKQSRKINRKKS